MNRLQLAKLPKRKVLLRRQTVCICSDLAAVQVQSYFLCWPTGKCVCIHKHTSRCTQMLPDHQMIHYSPFERFEVRGARAIRIAYWRQRDRNLQPSKRASFPFSTNVQEFETVEKSDDIQSEITRTGSTLYVKCQPLAHNTEHGDYVSGPTWCFRPRAFSGRTQIHSHTFFGLPLRFLSHGAISDHVREEKRAKVHFFVFRTQKQTFRSRKGYLERGIRL